MGKGPASSPRAQASGDAAPQRGGVINTGAPGESIERTYQRILANLEKA